MEEMVFFVGVGVVAFVAANVDNLFLLLFFLAEQGYSARDVVMGYLSGALGVLLVILAFSQIEGFLPVSYLRFLGIIPFLLGLKEALGLLAGASEAEAATDAPETAPEDRALRLGFLGRGEQVLTVALVGFSNSGDTMAAFAPLVAESNAAATVLLVGTFVAMTGAWLGAAFYCQRHRRVSMLIRQYGRYVLPFLLMALGLYIFTDTTSDLVQM